MGLLAMCDLAVAAPHAVFGLPEVKVGLFPAQVLSVLQHLLPRPPRPLWPHPLLHRARWVCPMRLRPYASWHVSLAFP